MFLLILKDESQGIAMRRFKLHLPLCDLCGNRRHKEMQFSHT
jgi:hypothetical protein